MNEIKVYPQEVADGISNLVKANASIAYVSPITNDATSEWTERFIDNVTPKISAKANRNIDKLDLYPIQTLLASIGWNKNADIFTKEPMWEARYSAEDKPFNFQHQQLDIIGHITGCFVVDDKKNLVPMDSSLAEVPNRFHIVTPAVIYRFWEDKAQRDRIEKIIAEIEEGDKWYVSMECLFSDFDYGLLNGDGEFRVIARNNQTAGLTKFLRQYGGNGVIEGGYSIGRVLKNILFSGKGLVSNPANPDSIIFDNVQTFKSISTELGYNNLTCPNINNSKGKRIMSEKSTEGFSELKAFNIEDNAAFKLIKSENEKMSKTIAELTDKLSAQSTEAVQKEIASLTSKVTTLETDLATATKSVEELTSQNKSLAAENEKFKKEAEDAKKEKAKAERTSALISVGAPENEAKAIVDQFENVSDDQFKSMAELLKDKWAKSASNDAEKATEEEFKKASKSKSAKDDDGDEKEDKMMKDCKADKVIETSKAEVDPPLGVTDVSTLEATRASIEAWYKTSVSRTTK